MANPNDAQPSIHRYNATFVADCVKLVRVFQALPNKPNVWIVLPPPIFSNQSGKMDTAYFEQTIIPGIQQAANITNLHTIDVYSALTGHGDYFSDGVHPNAAAAKIIANEVYKSIEG